MNFHKGDYARIIDNQTNKIIAEGKVCNSKYSYIDKDNKEVYKPCISFDDRIFFNINSNKFHVEKLRTIVNIPDNYSRCLWREVSKEDIDIYREFDTDELDEEVIPLVTSLNKLDSIETVGSCCGHNKTPLWVTLRITKLRSLNILLRIISKDIFFNKFILGTSISTKTLDSSGESVFLQLSTINIGKQAYNDADELAEYIDGLEA